MPHDGDCRFLGPSHRPGSVEQIFVGMKVLDDFLRFKLSEKRTVFEVL